MTDRQQYNIDKTSRKKYPKDKIIQMNTHYEKTHNTHKTQAQCIGTLAHHHNQQNTGAQTQWAQLL